MSNMTRPTLYLELHDTRGFLAWIEVEGCFVDNDATLRIYNNAMLDKALDFHMRIEASADMTEKKAQFFRWMEHHAERHAHTGKG